MPLPPEERRALLNGIARLETSLYVLRDLTRSDRLESDSKVKILRTDLELLSWKLEIVIGEVESAGYRDFDR